jgi:hypothetical protein
MSKQLETPHLDNHHAKSYTKNNIGLVTILNTATHIKYVSVVGSVQDDIHRAKLTTYILYIGNVVAEIDSWID